VRAGLLLEAMRGDRYPAVRKVAWQSLRSLAGAGRAEGALDAAGFDPGELRPAERERSIAQLRVRQVDAVVPDAARVAVLRERVSAQAIFIGE
jgi:hypothetical protein